MDLIPSGQIDPNHFYPTPEKLCSAVIARLDEDLGFSQYISVLDPGAGTGAWGKAFKKYNPKSYVVGVEIQEHFEEQGYDYYYWKQDFLKFVSHSYDLVIGNPPFNQAEEFIHHSLSLTKSGGYVAFLLRSAFKESKKRWKTLFQEKCFIREYQLVERPGFKPNKDGRNSPEHAYSIFVWQKDNYPDLIREEPSINWLSWR